MDINATPARRENFACHGDFLLDPGNSKFYKRASISELTELLKPGAASKKPKDETAPFYEAQLIHYGLQRTKDKARAKLRLMDAIHAKSLKVPSIMKEMESALKKDYQKSLKNTDTAASAQPVNPKPEDKKRKRQGGDTEPAPKKPAPQRGMQSSEARSDAETQTQIRPMQTARRGNWSGSASARSQTVASENHAGAGLSTETRFRTKQTAHRGNFNGSFGRESHMLASAHPQHRQAFFKDERDDQNDWTARQHVPRTQPRADPSESSLFAPGRWDVDCPDMRNEWAAECSMAMKYFPGPNGSPGILWGEYWFQMFEGVFKATLKARDGQGQHTFSLAWGGRETGEGELSFSRPVGGEITVLGTNIISGTFYNFHGYFEEMKFTGRRARGPQSHFHRELNSFEQEFEGYNERNHERERIGRWGKRYWD